MCACAKFLRLDYLIIVHLFFKMSIFINDIYNSRNNCDDDGAQQNVLK